MDTGRMTPGDVPAWRWRIEQQVQAARWTHRVECVMRTDDLLMMLAVFEKFERQVKALHEHIGELEQTVVDIREESKG